MFSESERLRYSRHFILPEMGESGQVKMKNAKVLVIGAGGLGCPILTYLAAAGIGTIGIVDDDQVEASNLHRQPLYALEDIGLSKVLAAAKQLERINPHIEVIVHAVRFSTENALEMIKPYDVVVDGSDNFPTRYLCNDACVISQKILVHGAINRFEGQVSVFNWSNYAGERSPNYRDLFPEMPPPGTIPDCAEAGVLGVLPGIIGTLMAAEVIKIIAGIGMPLTGKLLLFDALTMQSRIFKFKRNPLIQIDRLGEYGDVCAVKAPSLASMAWSVLQDKLLNNNDLQLIDVRTPAEYQQGHLQGSNLMPLAALRNTVNQIQRSKTTILICKSGQRSQEALTILEKEFGFAGLFYLQNGLLEVPAEKLVSGT